MVFTQKLIKTDGQVFMMVGGMKSANQDLDKAIAVAALPEKCCVSSTNKVLSVQAKAFLLIFDFKKMLWRVPRINAQ